MPPERRRSATRLLIATCIAFVLAVLVLDLGRWLPFPGEGPVALIRIFAPHLTLVALALVPVALVARSRALGLALVALAIVAVISYGDEWWSSPPDAPSHGSAPLEMATWNLEIGSRSGPATVAGLAASTADVIALQELTPTAAEAIEADSGLRARYLFRELVASDDVFGLGILSRYPLTDAAFIRGPSRMLATVATPDGPVRLIVAHPLPGRIALGPLGLPVGFDPRTRDEALGRVRETIDSALAADEPVLVVGDINTTPDDPAFEAFRGEMTDAHRAVGVGPGWTYRPNRLEGLGIGLIRIDVVFSDGLRPVAVWETCPETGDHCMVSASLARPLE